MSHNSSILYVVATPIGNLGDMTDRARQVLAQVDLIAAEDTRHTRRLLTHFGIKAKLCPYHDHNEAQMAERLLALLSQGRDLALVSDAGTPLISDPGFVLVRAARQRGFSVVPIPGSNAAICALSASGLPCDRFLFLGFPPRASARRRAWLTGLLTEPGTLVFYESGGRAAASLADMGAVLGTERRAVLARELTKRFETFIHAPLGALAERLDDDPEQRLGALVILVEGSRKTDETVREAEEERVLTILSDALPLKQAAALAARITGGNRNRLYQLALRRREHRGFDSPRGC
ncbi:16S rRNA (cytidine(1402)-2'-O)-methyltransferase [Candidatus Thiosymbion oneisti]|uniref:16S rRNA (cytidine(1402)-2'-O)-methyltransferase n=1 Tax=Candidatus Thiosymbion oneisti TaxID=589554 RepID=UPI000B1C01FC|nr:16S rRNA (cytidine(1402)-2'-O)-methyltransferase [Candidatus Thiosymbion oneisti]